MTVAAGIATACTFVWLGMVLAISFLEAPLKFRAPGVTLQIGLGIGRLVFRALNGVEAVLGAAAIVAVATMSPRGVEAVAVIVAVLALLVQLLLVRPVLTKRSDAVLAGGPDVASQSRSRAHYGYVGLEIIKVIALVVAGIVLLCR